MQHKTLLLIDANALIHRAYHALPPLTTREGVVVHAVYGFASVLLKVISDLQPDYIAAAFDLPEPTFRDELYEEYKAHRPETPDDLVEQVPLVRELLDVFGIPVLEAKGFEADDVIGTLAEMFRGQEDLAVVIVTGDLDTLQLVGENVSVYTLRRGMKDTTMYRTEEVEERYGVSVAQLPDHKGLMGDPSDNVPGVPGVGTKTATKILQEFDSMDDVYAALEKNPDDERVPARARTKLLEHKQDAFMSRELVTIRRDAPVALTLEEARWDTFDRDAAADLLRRLGFTSLLKRLPGDAQPTTTTASSGAKQKKLTDAAALTAFLKGAKELALFPEWDDTEGDRSLHGLRVELRDREGLVRVDRWRDVFDVLASHRGRIVVHNGKPLWKQMLSTGSSLPDAPYDTMLGAYLEYAQDGQKKLKDLFLAENTSTILDLADLQRARLSDDNLLELLEKIEIPLSGVLAAMENAGIAVNVERLHEVGERARDRLADLEAEIHDHAETSFTINSPQQLSEILFERLGLSSAGLKKTSTGMISTAESELAKIKEEHPIVPLVLEYRTFAKAISTYIEPLPKVVDPDTGRIHTTYHQAVTATGRLSSSDPNLQNIPVRGELAQEIRSAFIPADGKEFLAFDYSQIELRVAAVLAEDSAMLEAFEHGEDIHTRTAAEIFDVSPDAVNKDQRRLAKVLNFGVLYGMSAHGFSQAADTTREEAQSFIDRYMEEFSGLARYVEATEEGARAQGFVQTLFGRRRSIPEITASNYQVREAARRMAINMPIQGTAADLLKIAMLRVDAVLNDADYHDDIVLLLQIHDELLFEVHPQKRSEVVTLIRDTMEEIRTDSFLTERGVDFPIPLTVDVSAGSSWGALTPLDR